MFGKSTIYDPAATLSPERAAGSRTQGKKNNGVRFGLDQNIGASLARRSLEDAYYADTIQTGGGLTVTLAIVADGIGGEAFGERASRLTVETIFNFITQSTSHDLPDVLKGAVEAANRQVFQEASEESNKAGMGSTVTAALISAGRLYLASVGDSRAYLIRGNSILQLTQDHTWANEMVRRGKLRPDEAARNPHSGELFRSIGFAETVDVDLGIHVHAEKPDEAVQNQGMRLNPCDRVLLCTDGLTKTRPNGRGHFVEEEEITPAVNGNPPLQAARSLVSKALGRNVNDNVSVIVLEIPARFKVPIKPILGKAAIVLMAAGLISLMWSPHMSPFFGTTITPTVGEGYILIVNARGNSSSFFEDQEPITLSSGLALPVFQGSSLQTGEGTVIVAFPDSSKVYLDHDSRITIARMADPRTMERRTELTLERGRMLLIVQPYPGFSSMVLTNSGYQAHMEGSIMGVELLPQESALQV